MSAKDPVFEAWWPLPRTMELVRAPLKQVAELLELELKRIVPNETCAASWLPFKTINALFRSVDVLTSFPTAFLALPTTSEWSVVWTNSMRCDGYDTLCHNLTRLHGVDTLHFSSSDTDGSQQAATRFTFRRADDAGKPTRRVEVSRNDGTWTFRELGERLPGEPEYLDRIKRKRLNEAVLMEFLATLGARPWRASFYEQTRYFRLLRTNFPKTMPSRPTAEVVIT